MSTGVCGPDGIPILKRLTAMEPELAIPTPPKEEKENPILEEDDAGYTADEDVAVDETVETMPVEESADNTVPSWVWLSIAGAGIAWLWGVAYALSPTRTVYSPQ